MTQLDGSLSSLELTEIQKSDAEVIAPDFPVRRRIPPHRRIPPPHRRIACWLRR
jgi:hypothetical protein